MTASLQLGSAVLRNAGAPQAKRHPSGFLPARTWFMLLTMTAALPARSSSLGIIQQFLMAAPEQQSQTAPQAIDTASKLSRTQEGPPRNIL